MQHRCVEGPIPPITGIYEMSSRESEIKMNGGTPADIETSSQSKAFLRLSNIMKIKTGTIFYTLIRRTLQAALFIIFIVSLGLSIISRDNVPGIVLTIILGSLFCLSLWAERHTKRWGEKHKDMDPEELKNSRNRRALYILCTLVISISIGILLLKNSFDLGSLNLILVIVGLIAVIIRMRQEEK